MGCGPYAYIKDGVSNDDNDSLNYFYEFILNISSVWCYSLQRVVSEYIYSEGHNQYGYGWSECKLKEPNAV